MGPQQRLQQGPHLLPEKRILQNPWLLRKGKEGLGLLCPQAQAYQSGHQEECSVRRRRTRQKPLSAREIVTTTATAKATSSAPREADTPKSLAAPERERRTGTTVSPSPSPPKWSSRSPANAPLCAKPRVTAAMTTRLDPTRWSPALRHVR